MAAPKLSLFLYQRVLWLLLFCGAPLCSKGVGVVAEKSTEYLHETWQFEDGLPQNFVQVICQTRDGYLWVGTQNGLARFDGVQFTVFQPKDTPKLKSANIGALLESRDGSLWIGTEGGGLTRKKDGKLENFTKADGLAGDSIRSLFEAKDGTIWIGSRGDGTPYILTKFANGKFETVKELDDSENQAVRTICQDLSGTIWVATSKAIVGLKDGKLESEPQKSLRTVIMDRSGEIWLGNNGGMWRHHNGRRPFTKIDGLTDSKVTTLLDDSSGTMWIGTYGGLNRRTDGKFFTELNKENISYDAVNAIFEDREKNIWIGAKDGLSRLSRRTFTSYTTDDGLPANNVTSVCEDREGFMWVASWGGGLTRMKDGVFTNYAGKHMGLSNDLVLSIHQTRDGAIWFGNDYSAGLHKLKDGVIRHISTELGMSNITVRAILEDRNTNLWIGSQVGLIQLNAENDSFKTYTTSNGLPANLIKVLHQDNNDALWVGTMDGLCRLENGSFKNYNTNHGLGSKGIASIFTDSDGVLWVGTIGGLSRRVGDRFKTYTTQDGLFSDDIWEILEDDSKNLWMSSRVGVFRVSKADLAKFDKGELDRIPYTSFGKYDGMVSIECNSVARPAGWKSRDGRLWFATTKGLAVIDPKKADISGRIAPTVLIEQILVDKKKLAPAERLTLAPGQRDLEISYTALSFRAPKKVKFKYKLEGVDRGWVDAGSRRIAFYNNLKPGDYRFKVSACSSHGVWNDDGASILLTLKPHFYQTFAFYTLVAAGIIFLGVSIYHLRVRSLKDREQELEALVAERTQTLEAAVAERQRLQNEFMEMSRKAGMAEVASGVLHNVGNVLNSVNVSATLAADKIRSFRIARVEQAADLMAAHAEDFAGFAASEKGKQLPAYLKKLAQHLVEEQQSVVGELVSLRKNVEHIKEIVAMQQSLAKASGVVEPVNIIELMEDALQVSRSSLENHKVSVDRDFRCDREVTIDKHKLLQIVINLMRNAKQSCVESGRVEKWIKVKTLNSGPNTFKIAVEDNGVGIPPENITRIFSQGFTTRQNGHGFGLHSAANAARELGGRISVSSEGQNLGATFTIELPVKPKSDNDGLSVQE